MINMLISIFTSAYSMISSIYFNKKIEEFKKIVSNIKTEKQMLSEHLIYLPNIEEIKSIDPRYQKLTNDKYEIKNNLESLRDILRSAILSSAAKSIPNKIRQILRKDPKELLLDVSPVANGLTSPINKENMVPILFEENGKYYIGWQLYGVLPYLFGFEFIPDKSLLSLSKNSNFMSFKQSYKISKIYDHEIVNGICRKCGRSVDAIKYFKWKCENDLDLKKFYSFKPNEPIKKVHKTMKIEENKFEKYSSKSAGYYHTQKKDNNFNISSMLIFALILLFIIIPFTGYYLLDDGKEYHIDWPFAQKYFHYLSLGLFYPLLILLILIVKNFFQGKKQSDIVVVSFLIGFMIYFFSIYICGAMN